MEGDCEGNEDAVPEGSDVIEEEEGGVTDVVVIFVRFVSALLVSLTLYALRCLIRRFMILR